MRAAAALAHAKTHERAAVNEIDARPVPADRLGRHDCARPFVVEPSGAAHPPAVQTSDDAEVRAAVVVARLLRPVPLAAVSVFALQHELAGIESELEFEIARRDVRAVA